MELSYLNVHETYWLCKYVQANPLPPFIYTVVGYDQYGALQLRDVEDMDPLDPDRDFINDEL